MIAPLPTPAQRLGPPPRVARVCVNGHLADAQLSASEVAFIDVNRADPLAVRTGPQCSVCGAGTIAGCPGCGYPIPGMAAHLAYAVPHFCIVCGEFYPWTFRGEFYSTLAEILEETHRLVPADRRAALEILARLREGLAGPDEIEKLQATFEGLGGSDADLAREIMAVVVPGRNAATDV